MAKQIDALNKSDIYQSITDQMIEALEQVDVKNFSLCFKVETGMPVNVVTGAEYRGVNVLVLWMTAMSKRFNSNVWGTFKQWQEKGATVRKGEKSAQVVLYKKTEKTDKETGEITEYMLARSFALFNASQVEGWTAPAATEVNKMARNEKIESFVKATGARIVTGGGPCYRPSTDTVHMPEMSDFFEFHGSAEENYYSVLFHELTHWTKKDGRCDRNHDDMEPDQRYAAEELVAELGAAYLCGHFGIKQAGRDDHAMYLKSWLGALKNDKKYIFKAASLAQKAVDHLKSYSAETETEHEKRAA